MQLLYEHLTVLIILVQIRLGGSLAKYATLMYQLYHIVFSEYYVTSSRRELSGRRLIECERLSLSNLPHFAFNIRYTVLNVILY